MFTAMLIAQITILSSAPRLSPEEAVRVLKAGGSMADRTDAPVHTDPQLSPLSIMVRSAPGDGPFGVLRSSPLTPTWTTLRFRLPRQPNTRSFRPVSIRRPPSLRTPGIARVQPVE